jgi:hypothetical protein
MAEQAFGLHMQATVTGETAAMHATERGFWTRAKLLAIGATAAIGTVLGIVGNGDPASADQLYEKDGLQAFTFCIGPNTHLGLVNHTSGPFASGSISGGGNTVPTGSLASGESKEYDLRTITVNMPVTVRINSPSITLPFTSECQPEGAITPTIGPTPEIQNTNYRLFADNGEVFSYGVSSFGSLADTKLNKSIVTGANTSNGYYEVASDGGVFAFGDAKFYGSTGNINLNQPIVGMAPTPNNNGYWLVASDGGIFAFGNAEFHGSTGDRILNQPVVGMAATASGEGYWLVASDGGVFAFGDAKFYGSTGAIKLNKPIRGIAATPAGKGYWIVAEDGGIFAFGDAKFYGSTGAIKLNQTIRGMAGTDTGMGYYLVASDGGVFAFGDAPFKGSPAPLNRVKEGPSAVAIDTTSVVKAVG